MRITLIFLFLLIIGQVFARPVPYLVRSPKALLMGDAFTALADDEYTLFYNPAALGEGDMFSMTPAPLDIGVTNALDSKKQEKFKNFPKNDTVAIANRIMGVPLYFHGGATPTIKLGNIGFSFIGNVTANIVLRNTTHPILDVDYRIDRGFVVGAAFDLHRSGSRKTGKSRGSKNKVGRRTSMGIGIKHINRQGIDASYDLFGVDLLNAIASNSKDIHTLRSALGYSKGDGWGGDLGFKHVEYMGSAQLSTGFSVMDIADTRFKLEEGTRKVAKQDMHMNWGAAWKQDFTLFNYAFSFDIHPINSAIDWGRKVHIGMEIGIPLISAYAGWSEGYVSYGVGVNLGLIKVIAGFYSVESGGKFKQEESDRGLIYISLLDFSFDG